MMPRAVLASEAQGPSSGDPAQASQDGGDRCCLCSPPSLPGGSVPMPGGPSQPRQRGRHPPEDRCLEPHFGNVVLEPKGKGAGPPGRPAAPPMSPSVCVGNFRQISASSGPEDSSAAAPSLGKPGSPPHHHLPYRVGGCGGEPPMKKKRLFLKRTTLYRARCGGTWVFPPKADLPSSKAVNNATGNIKAGLGGWGGWRARCPRGAHTCRRWGSPRPRPPRPAPRRASPWWS